MDPSFHPVATLCVDPDPEAEAELDAELERVVVRQRTSLEFRALPVPSPPDNCSRWAILRDGSLVRRLKPIICDPDVLRSVEADDDLDEDELEDEERKARGDVVEVEVVAADVVSENASAHSYRR